MSRVSLRGVRKRFGKVSAIHDVDLAIDEGEFCCFVGPSGCGKSTLLRLVAGLEAVSEGEIHIDGKRVDHLPPAKRGVAMVFQSYALYPHMTVYQNMAFGLQQARLGRQVIQSRIANAAQMLQIDELLDRLPRQLSGGQRQRVAIGRAIVREPGVFLFDEPLSNLDAALRQQTRVEIARLHRRLGATMIYVTHDQTEAMTLADKIVVLRAGRVEQIGDPMTLYHSPANRFVAGFIGAPPMNFLKAQLVVATTDYAEVTLPTGPTVTARADATRLARGSEVSFGIRPEHVTLTRPNEALLSADVVLCEQLGDHGLAVLDLGGGQGTLTIKLAPDALPGPGQGVGLALPPEHCHLFDAEGMSCRRTI